MKRHIAISLAIIFLSVAVTMLFYQDLPEKIPSHWDAEGNADSYMPKNIALSIMPMIALALLGLFAIIPSIDPLKRNIEVFRTYYEWFIVLFSGFLSYLQVLILAYSVSGFNFVQLLVPALSILFYYAGVMMKHTKRNWFIGIRTPWTLSSDDVWKKSHALGSRMLKISAIVMLFGVFVPGLAILLVVVSLIIITFSVVIYSYVEYRKEEMP